jgi:hypothetical protein
MAALNQSRRHDDDEKIWLAEQHPSAGRRGRGGLGLLQWAEPQTDRGGEHGCGGNDPDQVPGGDDVDQDTAGQRADHKRRRAP